MARHFCGAGLEDFPRSLGDPLALRKISVSPPLRDNFDTSSLVYDLNLSSEPRSLPQFYQEKHDVLLEGRLLPVHWGLKSYYTITSSRKWSVRQLASRRRRGPYQKNGIGLPRRC